MKLTQIEKLVNFCNKVTIENNEDTRGLCAYFEYKDKQYYISMVFTNDNGPDCMIFPALDRSVASWRYLYHTNDIEEVSKKNIRQCIFDFLSNV